MRVSVLIITRDRGKELNDCLSSIKRQIVKPYEVVVVDNGSTDNTKEIVNSNNDSLNIHYLYEKKAGRSFARNKGLENINGEIIAFIDDDCIASKNWIKNIKIVFEKNKLLAGVVGFSENYYVNNVYSQIEQFFYVRWLNESIGHVFGPVKIKDGSLVDTKNSAFRLLDIANLSFKSGAFDLDEDVLFGKKLIDLGKKIAFIPNIKVSHKNSASLMQILKKNFMKGCSLKKINKQSLVINYNNKILRTTFSLFGSYFSEKSFVEKICILLISILYILSYKIGMLYSRFFILV